MQTIDNLNPLIGYTHKHIESFPQAIITVVLFIYFCSFFSQKKKFYLLTEQNITYHLCYVPLSHASVTQTCKG